MAMKKNISKALAMAVMMSVLAGGSAYAENSVIVFRPAAGSFYDMDGSPEIRISKDSSVEGKTDTGNLSSASLSFTDSALSNLPVATYGNKGIILDDHAEHAGHVVVLNNYQGLNMGNLAIKGVTDITATGNAEIGGNLTVNGTITADTSGAIASGETALVTGGAVYTALQGYVEKGFVASTAGSSIAVGAGSFIDNDCAFSVAMGKDARVGSFPSGAPVEGGVIRGTAVGTGAIVLATRGTALGNNAWVMYDSESSTAIGDRATVWDNSICSEAIGMKAYVGKNLSYAVALGSESEATETNTVSVGNDTLKRKIVNVADGENDTDAVNYSQIKADDGNYVKADKTVAQNFTALDGQVKTNADDIATLKSDMSTAKSNISALQSDMSAAQGAISTLQTDVGALDTRVTAVEGFAGDISALQADVATNKTDISGLKSDVSKNKTDISDLKSDVANKANQADLNAEETARINADKDLQSQIDAIGSGSSAGMAELNNKISATNDRVDRVGATAAALAGINYQPMAKGQSQVAVGMGGYKGKKATALGLAYQFNDRVSGSVAGAANGSEHMFNVGFNYLFGQHSDKDIAQMAAAPGSVSLKEAELQAQVDSLKADNAAMRADNQAMQARMAQLEAMVKALAAK